MTIRVDSTKISSVVKCSQCPWWSGFADSRSQGWAVGARHEARAHAGSDQARKAERMTRRRAS